MRGRANSKQTSSFGHENNSLFIAAKKEVQSLIRNVPILGEQNPENID